MSSCSASRPSVWYVRPPAALAVCVRALKDTGTGAEGDRELSSLSSSPPWKSLMFQRESSCLRGSNLASFSEGELIKHTCGCVCECVMSLPFMWSTSFLRGRKKSFSLSFTNLRWRTLRMKWCSPYLGTELTVMAEVRWLLYYSYLEVQKITRMMH